MTLSAAGGILTVAGGVLAGTAPDTPPVTAGFVDVKSDLGFEATSNVPALVGIEATDALVAFAATHSGALEPTPPAGWTKIGDSTAGTLRCTVWTAPGSASTATTWAWGSSFWRTVVIGAWRGVVAPAAAGVNVGAVAGTTIDAPSRTLASPGGILACFGYSSLGTARTFPAGLTERLELTGTAGSVLADEPRPAAGATGIRTFTTDSSSAILAASVALEPA